MLIVTGKVIVPLDHDMVILSCMQRKKKARQWLPPYTFK